MAAKPIVDGIEKEYQQSIDVIHLDVREPEAEPFLQQYGFQYTPTFILFDAEGNERWRSVGALETNSLRKAISELQ